jgi:hypothetical protein
MQMTCVHSPKHFAERVAEKLFTALHLLQSQPKNSRIKEISFSLNSAALLFGPLVKCQHLKLDLERTIEGNTNERLQEA